MKEGKKITLSREIEARDEIERTSISHRGAKWASIVFIAILIFVPLMQVALDYSQGKRTILPFTASESMTEKPLIQSVFSFNKAVIEWKIDWEKQLEEESFLRDIFPAPFQWSLTALMGTGNEKAIMGKEGWLFYRNDVDYLANKGFLQREILKLREQNEAVNSNPIDAIIDFRNQLAKMGIELIVLPTPNKAMVMPEKLSSSFDDNTGILQNESYQAFINKLQQYHVNVFDISELIRVQKLAGRDVFLKTDTHWTPETMQKIAKTLADSIAALTDLENDTSIYMRKPVNVKAQGDIALMLKLTNPAKYFEPQTVTIQQVWCKNKLWEADENAEVLLLGDSYANIFSVEDLGWGTSAGLSEQLSYELNKGLDRICQNGGGAYTTREILATELKRGNNRLKNKKVVVWQFAIRELAEGNWKTIPMDISEKQENDFLQLQNGDSMVVSAKIIDVAKVPRPGTVPYKDHVVSVVLSDIAIKNETKKALVYMLSMSDNVWTKAATLKSGNSINIRLTAWDDVKQKYESINRSEPTDDAYAFEQPCWGELLEYDVLMNTENTPADTINTEIQQNNKNEIIEIKKSILNSDAKQLRDICANLLSTTEELTIKGQEGWLFHREDLKQITYNQFWGNSAVNIPISRNAAQADPYTALKAYNNECKKAGIRLLVVPIPPKAAIYPDYLATNSSKIPLNVELTPFTNQFYKELQKAGVEVLDVRRAFFDARKNGIKVYCMRDSHFSGEGAGIVSGEIAKQIKTESWYKDIAKIEYVKARNEIDITGDLCSTLAGNTFAPEKIVIQTITNTEGNFIEKNPQSPVLLLADSHGLVYNEGGDMFAVGSGLFDLLSADLGFDINMLAIKGSAGRTARISLYRELKKTPEELNNIKVIVYCFTAREFTSGAWGVVPLR